MDIGFALPVSGSWATPANVLTVARKAEQLGYRSLWTFQRLLAPRDLPPAYRSVLDPTVVLGYAAAVTERVELGVAIINAPFESPALLAKQFATLDVLSGGRALVGLGLGWLPQEFAASNVPFERRGPRFEEYLRALEAIWDEDPVSFEGEFYTVPSTLASPKPVRRAGRRRPPVLIGGDAPAALARIGRMGDGWISSSRVPPTELGRRIEAVRAAAREAGRDTEALRFVCRGVTVVGERSRPLTGSLAQIRADLPSLAEQGVTEMFVDLNFDSSIGHPDADPEISLRRAHEALEALAPDA